MSRRKPQRAVGPGATLSNSSARAARGSRSARRQRRSARKAAKSERVARAAKVKQPRRRFGRLATGVVLVGLMLTVLALGGQWMLRQSYFRVQHVTFVGLHHETVSQVLAATGLELHPTMIGLDTATLTRKLEQFAWIEGVRVIKHWPNSLEIRIHESTPVAVAFDSHHVLQYVDRRGRELGHAPLNANLPTLQYTSPARTSWPYERAGRNAALVASALPPAFAAQVSVVSVNWHGSVELKMTTPVSFIIGPPTQLHAKFVAIASVIAHSTLGPGDVVDVTVPSELAVSGPPPG